MSPSSNQSPETNSDQTLTIKQIVDTISRLRELALATDKSLPRSVAENKDGKTTDNQSDSKAATQDVGSSTSNCCGFTRAKETTGGKNENAVPENAESNDTNRTNVKNGSSHSHPDDSSDTITQLERLCNDLVYMKNAFSRLKDYEDKLSKPVQTLDANLKVVLGMMKEVAAPGSKSSSSERVRQAMLRKINKDVTNLKCQIPSPHQLASTTSDSHRHKLISHRAYDVNNLPKLHTSDKFRCNSSYLDLLKKFKSLDATSQNCLLCFGAFPDNAVVKRRLLINWWVGEKFLDAKAACPKSGDKAKKAEEIRDLSEGEAKKAEGLLNASSYEDKAPERRADVVLASLVEKGFIEPVHKKRRRKANSFKMHPFVLSALIVFAQQQNFFTYDSDGNPGVDFLSSGRACLVKDEEEQSRRWKALKDLEKNHENLKTLFNVDENFPDFSLEVFSRMKNLKVLCMGRWRSSAMHHIEVESTEFLKGLKNMGQLRFLSLHGMSGIDKFPISVDRPWSRKSSISKLTELRILDLRACYNLEQIPEGIGSLKNLIHLDISECYLLDQMPKELCSLSALQVLKGFVISSNAKPKNSCSLADLAKLTNLRKLSINVNKEDSLIETEISDLKEFKALRKLTIAWGGDNNKPENVTEKSGSKNVQKDENEKKQESVTPRAFISWSKSQKTFKREDPQLPRQLEKLDIQCFPETAPPTWLMPQNLTSLRRLCVRGGNLSNLGKNSGPEASPCKVEALRLKYLSEFRMTWKELQVMFPDMRFLEKVKCPHVTFCPCDEKGVWLKS